MDSIQGHEIRFEVGMVEITGPKVWLKGAVDPDGNCSGIREIINFLLDQAEKQNAIWNERRKEFKTFCDGLPDREQGK